MSKTLAVRLFAFVGLSLLLAGAMSPAKKAGGPGDDEIEPSSCIADASLSLTASPTQVAFGQSSNIRWSVQLPAGCSTAQIKLNGLSVPASGQRAESLTASKTYRLLLSIVRQGVNQQTSRSVTVNVSYPDRVVINRSTPRPVETLIGALGSSNSSQIVELCDVDINMTGKKDIGIGNNRSLIASPGCARNARRLGPRIFVTDTRGGSPLFTVYGDRVLISGFRLEGPTDGIGAQGRKETGILILPEGRDRPDDDALQVESIVVSNMEIFRWSGAAVSVRDNTRLLERGRMSKDRPWAVQVRDSYIHHNQHSDGFGYGVVVGKGAYTTIHRNAFDENRHAIAGGSRNDNRIDYTGYALINSLILSGGGKHCSESFLGDLVHWSNLNCWMTHQVDMHGDGSEWLGNWNCGTAGEHILIEGNAILYTAGYAVKIRGNPRDQVRVNANVFAHGSRGSAINQNGACGFGENITRPVEVTPNNDFGVNPMQVLGQCDFFGDGMQDSFMATGASWWARSPTTGHWRFLNSKSEPLAQLVLADLDGDGICDVGKKPNNPAMAVQTYSKSGTGPWQDRFVLDPG